MSNIQKRYSQHKTVWRIWCLVKQCGSHCGPLDPFALYNSPHCYLLVKKRKKKHFKIKINITLSCNAKDLRLIMVFFTVPLWLCEWEKLSVPSCFSTDPCREGKVPWMPCEFRFISVLGTLLTLELVIFSALKEHLSEILTWWNKKITRHWWFNWLNWGLYLT